MMKQRFYSLVIFAWIIIFTNCLLGQTNSQDVIDAMEVNNLVEGMKDEKILKDTAVTKDTPFVVPDTAIENPIVIPGTPPQNPVLVSETPLQNPVVLPETPLQNPVVLPETPLQNPVKVSETPLQSPAIVSETPLQNPVVVPEVPPQPQISPYPSTESVSTFAKTLVSNLMSSQKFRDFYKPFSSSKDYVYYSSQAVKYALEDYNSDISDNAVKNVSLAIASVPENSEYTEYARAVSVTITKIFYSYKAISEYNSAEQARDFASKYISQLQTGTYSPNESELSANEEDTEGSTKDVLTQLNSQQPNPNANDAAGNVIENSFGKDSSQVNVIPNTLEDTADKTNFYNYGKNPRVEQPNNLENFELPGDIQHSNQPFGMETLAPYDGIRNSEPIAAISSQDNFYNSNSNVPDGQSITNLSPSDTLLSSKDTFNSFPSSAFSQLSNKIKPLHPVAPKRKITRGNSKNNQLFSNPLPDNSPISKITTFNNQDDSAVSSTRSTTYVNNQVLDNGSTNYVNPLFPSGNENFQTPSNSLVTNTQPYVPEIKSIPPITAESTSNIYEVPPNSVNYSQDIVGSPTDNYGHSLSTEENRRKNYVSNFHFSKNNLGNGGTNRISFAHSRKSKFTDAAVESDTFSVPSSYNFENEKYPVGGHFESPSVIENNYVYNKYDMPEAYTNSELPLISNEHSSDDLSPINAEDNKFASETSPTIFSGLSKLQESNIFKKSKVGDFDENFSGWSLKAPKKFNGNNFAFTPPTTNSETSGIFEDGRNYDTNTEPQSLVDDSYVYNPEVTSDYPARDTHSELPYVIDEQFSNNQPEENFEDSTITSEISPTTFTGFSKLNKYTRNSGRLPFKTSKNLKTTDITSTSESTAFAENKDITENSKYESISISQSSIENLQLFQNTLLSRFLESYDFLTFYQQYSTSDTSISYSFHGVIYALSDYNEDVKHSVAYHVANSISVIAPDSSPNAYAFVVATAFAQGLDHFKLISDNAYHQAIIIADKFIQLLSTAPKNFLTPIEPSAISNNVKWSGTGINVPEEGYPSDSDSTNNYIDETTFDSISGINDQATEEKNPNAPYGQIETYSLTESQTREPLSQESSKHGKSSFDFRIPNYSGLSALRKYSSHRKNEPEPPAEVIDDNTSTMKYSQDSTETIFQEMQPAKGYYCARVIEWCESD